MAPKVPQRPMPQLEGVRALSLARHVEGISKLSPAEGRAAAFEHFPSFEEYPHLFDLFEVLSAERIHSFE